MAPGPYLNVDIAGLTLELLQHQLEDLAVVRQLRRGRVNNRDSCVAEFKLL